MFRSGIRRISSCYRLVTLLAVLLLAQYAAGGIVLFHNGTVDSNPPGIGEVDVLFDSTTGGKVFLETATHVLIGLYDQGPVSPTVEAVFNATPGDQWIGYQFMLLGAGFSGLGSGLPAPAINPVEMNGLPGDATIDFYNIGGSVTIAYSQIFQDEENSILNIIFDDPVDVGESFLITFDVQDIGSPGVPGIPADLYVIAQNPVIPEPTTAVILIVGLGGLGRRLIRRRRLGR